MPTIDHQIEQDERMRVVLDLKARARALGAAILAARAVKIIAAPEANRTSPNPSG